LKLFCWYPKYHGPVSMFIMAEDVSTAKRKVREYLEKTDPEDLDYWPSEYESVEVKKIYEIAFNAND